MKQIPEKGDKVTVSTNKVTRDRSYAYAVWEVVEVNETHVKLKCLTGDDFWAENSPIILQIHEHEFSSAENFLE